MPGYILLAGQYDRSIWNDGESASFRPGSSGNARGTDAYRKMVHPGGGERRCGDLAFADRSSAAGTDYWPLPKEEKKKIIRTAIPDYSL